MTTARVLITDAMFANGSYGRGDTLQAADAQLGLRTLQRMADSWSNDNLQIPYTALTTETTVASTANYPLSGFTPTTRPVSIQNVWLDANIDEPLESLTEEEYNNIPVKTITGIPTHYFYKPSGSSGTFYLYPTPNGAYALNVQGRYQLSAGTTLDTDIVLPPGYEAALVAGLGVALCDYHGIDVKPSLMQQSINAKNAVARTNHRTPKMALCLPGTGYAADIRSDT